jgi:hypothetical protein
MKFDPADDSQVRRPASRHHARTGFGEIRFRSPRPRSPGESILVFAVIPSLLMWAVIFLIIDGNWQGAAQLIGTSVAAGFVGWVLGSDA